MRYYTNNFYGKDFFSLLKCFQGTNINKWRLTGNFCCCCCKFVKALVTTFFISECDFYYEPPQLLPEIVIK